MDQELADLLAAHDEKLRGEAADGDGLPLAPRLGDSAVGELPELGDLQDLMECIQTLESLWPRAPLSEPVRLDMAPRGEVSQLAGGIRPEKAILQIGRFEVERVLGEGGFGIVYLAYDPVLDRQVALKVPRVYALAGTKTRERFRREAQAAATLDHPNIVPIYETGEERALCYIASAYCPGPNLAQWLKQQSSPVCPRLAAALIARLADAAHYSHERGVLHRDLKPSNVMLVPPTSAALSIAEESLPFIPRLTDFGLAKLLEETRDESAISAMLGTPSYMAPEQIEGSAQDVDPRTDVYALGTVLYELLAGRPPFQGTNVADVLDEVRNGEPMPSRRLRRAVPRDLDIICLKCLEKLPSRRYATARELGEDLYRFLHGEPVHARQPSRVDVALKWVRRRPAMSAALALSALAILSVTLSGWYYNHHLSRALQVAEQLRIESLEREQRLRLQMYAADLRLAWKAWEAGDMTETLTHLSPYQPQAAENDLRGFEWHFLRASLQADVQSLPGHVAPILTVDVSSDDRYIASGDRGGVVRICESGTGKEARSFQYSQHEVTSVRFSPDGRTLATAGQDRSIRLWNVKDWSQIACLRGHELTVTAVEWSPDGKHLVSSGRDSKVKVWDAACNWKMRSLADESDVVRAVAWSPDGQVLAAAVRDGGLRLWQTSDWTLVGSQPLAGTEGILALAFSPDSRRLASAGYGGNLLIHDLATQRVIAEVDLPNTVWSLRFSPDGRMLIAGRGDGLLNLWETQTTEGELAELRTIRIGAGAVRGVAFSSQGQAIVAATEQDRTLQVRSTSDLTGCSRYHFTPACHEVAGPRNSALLFDPSGSVSLAPMIARGLDQSDRPRLSQIIDATLLPLGDLVASSSTGTGVTVYDSTTLEVRSRLEADEKIRAISVSPAGQQLAGSGQSGTVWLWSMGTRSPCIRLPGHHTAAVHTAFSTDGKLLASASADEQQIVLWNTASGRRIADFEAAQGVAALAFSPGGSTLAIAGLDHTVLLCDVSSRTKLGILRGHVGAVRAVAFSPAGETLATAADDGTARLWHVATQQELCVLARCSVPLIWVRFLSSYQLAAGTSPYGSNPPGNNDVLVFDARDHSRSFGTRIQPDEPESRRWATTDSVQTVLDIH